MYRPWMVPYDQLRSEIEKVLCGEVLCGAGTPARDFLMKEIAMLGQPPSAVRADRSSACQMTSFSLPVFTS
jgi:hypothetical protein